MQETARKFHRRSRRIRIAQPVRVIPCIPRGELFEEIATTANVSREGFYFLTERQQYEVGMRLAVVLPYHSPPASSDREYLAQVVRVELLENGQRGIAIRLLSTIAE